MDCASYNSAAKAAEPNRASEEGSTTSSAHSDIKICYRSALLVEVSPGKDVKRGYYNVDCSEDLHGTTSFKLAWRLSYLLKTHGAQNLGVDSLPSVCVGDIVLYSLLKFASSANFFGAEW